MISSGKNISAAIQYPKLESRIPTWALISPIVIFLLLSFSILLGASSDSFNADGVTLLAPICLYLCSHILRAIRLNVIFTGLNLNFSVALWSHLMGSVIGIHSLIFGETVKLLTLAKHLKKNFGAVLVSVIFTRLLDFVTLTSFLLLFQFSGERYNRTASAAIVWIGILIISAWSIFPSLSAAVTRHLVRNVHTRLSTKIVNSLANLRATVSTMKLDRADFVLSLFLYSSLIWLIEVAAIYLIIDGTGLKSEQGALFAALDNVLSRIPMLSNFIEQNTLELYSPLYLALTGLTITTFVIYLLKTSSRNKEE